MAPVRTQNDQCKAAAILSSTKRLLHIGKRVSGWLEQTAVRVRLGSSRLRLVAGADWFDIMKAARPVS
jgi:hypothetical protein